jgi:hypothetical protein
MGEEMPGKRNKAKSRDSATWLGSVESLDDLPQRSKLQPDDVEQLRQILGRISDADPAHWFAWQIWARELVESLKKSSGNQFATTSFSLARLFFIVPLPLLTGLGALVGTHATWLPWLTFALTLGAALISQYVSARAYGPRWALYHRYAESLFEEGQLYVERAGRYDPKQSTPALEEEAVKNLFVMRITELQNNKTNQYDQIVHLASVSGVNGGAKN